MAGSRLSWQWQSPGHKHEIGQPQRADGPKLICGWLGWWWEAGQAYGCMRIAWGALGTGFGGVRPSFKNVCAAGSLRLVRLTPDPECAPTHIKTCKKHCKNCYFRKWPSPLSAKMQNYE